MKANNTNVPLDLDVEKIPSLLARVKESVNEEDYRILEASLNTLLHIAGLLSKKTATIRRLTKLLFGTRSEKTSEVVPKTDEPAPPEAPSNGEKEKPPKKPKGHGRNKTENYQGATRIPVVHPSLQPGDPCPEGCLGKLYLLKEPARLLRFRGEPPIQATIYEFQRLRCKLCGKVFTAPAPEGVGEDKYDPSVAAMIAMLKYGTGLPLNRLERLQKDMGIPLSSSTQWDILHHAAPLIKPALEELIRQGAQGRILHNDDTPMKILALMGKDKKHKKKGSKKRAVFTSGIISILEGIKIALFHTGPKHAGEAIAEVLACRTSGLAPPIQMCDALSWNIPKAFETILANCLTHGRRKFVDVVADFPDECRYVIETLADVYRNDARTKEQGMDPVERLLFHQAESAPLMEKLHDWLTEQRDTKKVEPNSGLGQAISHMLKHWKKFTRFLQVPGAPLDNNICERALKKAILHRKNSLFYKTQNGAHVGDLYMSFIHTCELNNVDPFHYLTELMKHSQELQANPEAWMPWNYIQTLQFEEARQATPT